MATYTKPKEPPKGGTSSGKAGTFGGSNYKGDRRGPNAPPPKSGGTLGGPPKPTGAGVTGGGATPPRPPAFAGATATAGASSAAANGILGGMSVLPFGQPAQPAPPTAIPVQPRPPAASGSSSLGGGSPSGNGGGAPSGNGNAPYFPNASSIAGDANYQRSQHPQGASAYSSFASGMGVNAPTANSGSDSLSAGGSGSGNGGGSGGGGGYGGGGGSGGGGGGYGGGGGGYSSGGGDQSAPAPTPPPTPVPTPAPVPDTSGGDLASWLNQLSLRRPGQIFEMSGLLSNILHARPGLYERFQTILGALGFKPAGDVNQNGQMSDWVVPDQFTFDPRMLAGLSESDELIMRMLLARNLGISDAAPNPLAMPPDSQSANNLSGLSFGQVYSDAQGNQYVFQDGVLVPLPNAAVPSLPQPNPTAPYAAPVPPEVPALPSVPAAPTQPLY
jgi:hypothetical protein